MEISKEMDILLQEIHKLRTLLVKIDKGSEPLDALTAQKQKVLDVLPLTPTYMSSIVIGRLDIYPIHKLLMCRPFTKTEIPLDVIEKLIESGFDVNARFATYAFDREVLNLSCNCTEYTCLNLAIKNEHYSAVRYLLQHGADCEIGSIQEIDDHLFVADSADGRPIRTPIAELALKANAPLDLFDLLATPRSLLNSGDNTYLPLHLAIEAGNSESAMRLIKLGADVNLTEARLKRPIELYERGIKEYHRGIKEYHDELFVCIMPTDIVSIIQCMHQFVALYVTKVQVDDQNQTRKMIHRLLQHIQKADHLRIDLETAFLMASNRRSVLHLDMMINQELVRFHFLNDVFKWMNIYVWSVLFVNLGWEFRSTPQLIGPRLNDSVPCCHVQLASNIDDTWNTYRDTATVMSLQNVCIQQARRCMRDFSDESFTSLPVPNKLRRLLMYEHVADIVCEAMEFMKQTFVTFTVPRR